MLYPNIKNITTAAKETDRKNRPSLLIILHLNDGIEIMAGTEPDWPGTRKPISNPYGLHTRSY